MNRPSGPPASHKPCWAHSWCHWCWDKETGSDLSFMFINHYCHNQLGDTFFTRLPRMSTPNYQTPSSSACARILTKFEISRTWKHISNDFKVFWRLKNYKYYEVFIKLMDTKTVLLKCLELVTSHSISLIKVLILL